MLSESTLKTLHDMWVKNGGRGWEPKNPNSPAVEKVIEAGYVRRCDMRCMFERLKDAGLTWTEAGRAAMQAMDEKVAA